MDHVVKFMRRLDRKLFDRVESCIANILFGSIEGLDIKPLSGYPNTFRCRVGTIRIIFEKHPDHSVIIDVDFRNNVYRRLKR